MGGTGATDRKRLNKVHLPKLTSEHLTLDEFTPLDAPILSALATHPDIYRNTLDIPASYSENLAREWIEHLYQPTQLALSQLVWAIRKNPTKELMGVISLTKLNHQNRNGTLGYWLGHRYWRQGHGTRACELVLDYGFKSLNLHKVHAEILEHNERSIALLERIGFQKEGHLRQNIMKDQKWLDLVIFALFSHQWPKTKETK